MRAFHYPFKREPSTNSKKYIQARTVRALEQLTGADRADCKALWDLLAAEHIGEQGGQRSEGTVQGNQGAV